MSNLCSGSGSEASRRWTVGSANSAGVMAGKTLIKDLVPHQPNTVCAEIHCICPLHFVGMEARS